MPDTLYVARAMFPPLSLTRNVTRYAAIHRRRAARRCTDLQLA
jgi:hypothetical protein